MLDTEVTLSHTADPHDNRIVGTVLFSVSTKLYQDAIDDENFAALIADDVRARTLGLLVQKKDQLQAVIDALGEASGTDEPLTDGDTHADASGRRIGDTRGTGTESGDLGRTGDSAGGH